MIFERFLKIIWISLSYYFAYRIGKDLGRDLKVIFILFGPIWDSYLNDFGDHVAMIFFLLFILFQYNFQIMRSLCQEECEADVSILLRSRCQNEFQIMRSLFQEQCEADVKILGSRARTCLISMMRKIDIAFS